MPSACNLCPAHAQCVGVRVVAREYHLGKGGGIGIVFCQPQQRDTLVGGGNDDNNGAFVVGLAPPLPLWTNRQRAVKVDEGPRQILQRQRRSVVEEEERCPGILQQGLCRAHQGQGAIEGLMGYYHPERSR